MIKRKEKRNEREKELILFVTKQSALWTLNAILLNFTLSSFNSPFTYFPYVVQAKREADNKPSLLFATACRLRWILLTSGFFLFVSSGTNNRVPKES